jgi:acyl carrier protein
MNQFLEKMADILEVEAADLQADTNFRDLPTWDSLAQLSFLALAQDDYSKNLTSENLKAANTFEDLFKLVSV